MADEWVVLEHFCPGATSMSWPWQMVLSTFSGMTLIKIEAVGSWAIIPGLNLKCGPDGQSLLRLREDETPLAGCAPGALIGKIGGSTADNAVALLDPPAPAAAAAPTGTTPPAAPAAANGGTAAGLATSGGAFVVGTMCIIAVSPAMQGPLFLGFNTRERPTAVTNVDVTISGLPQS